MKICYIDEAGCPGALPSVKSDVQPVMAICGIVIDAQSLTETELKFSSIRRRFYPGAHSGRNKQSGHTVREIKGSELRRDLCGTHRKRTTARGFLKEVTALCAESEIKIFGTIWIKAPGGIFDGAGAYSTSLQNIAGCFQRYLTASKDSGIIIADSRTETLNAKASYSIFTKKFQAARDEYSQVSCVPTFGQSEHHVGLQIADLLCSGILFPVSAWTYCRGLIDSTHIRVGYDELKRDFMPEIQILEYQNLINGCQLSDGLIVNDNISRRSAALLYELPPPRHISPDIGSLPLFRSRDVA